MFSSEEITQIAKEIANQQIHDTWYVFALIALITCVSSAIGAFLTSYVITRGKNLATKSDFEAILNQVKQTTITTESIKSVISSKQSESLEIKSMYRGKLEDLFMETYALKAWNEKIMARASQGEVPMLNDSPMGKIEMYQTMYFKDLALELHAIRLADIKLHQFLGNQLDKEAIFNQDVYQNIVDSNNEAVTKFRDALLEKYSERFGL